MSRCYTPKRHLLQLTQVDAEMLVGVLAAAVEEPFPVTSMQDCRSAVRLHTALSKLLDLSPEYSFVSGTVVSANDFQRVIKRPECAPEAMMSRDETGGAAYGHIAP